MTQPDLRIRAFQGNDQATVILLWRQCGLVRPNNDPVKDIARKLRVNPELFLVATIDEKLVGTAMAGYEGHRGWINYLAVAPEHQRKGVARTLLDHAEQLLRELGCPKINLQVRTSNTEALQFYRRIGFITDDVVSMGKRLVQD